MSFAVTYVHAARSAYERGHSEYGEIAKTIALNAYATASRFANRLPGSLYGSVLDDVEKLRLEIESEWPSVILGKEIA